MSTGYGEFVSRDGKRVYADASQIGQRVSLCGENDADVYFELGKEEANSLLVALSLAYCHNRWLWHDPLGEESERNALLLKACCAALNREPCWEDTVKAALHNAQGWEE
jgi:hypothetical protein